MRGPHDPARVRDRRSPSFGLSSERRNAHEATAYDERGIEEPEPIVTRPFPRQDITCVEGLSLDPEDVELWFREAVVHRFSGEPAEAEKCWRLILTLSRPEKFASMAQGI